MTTDPVQEARARVWREYMTMRVSGYSPEREEAHDAALDAYAAAIRAEEAARVLSILEKGEWPIYDPVYGEVVRLITDLRALVKEGEDD